ncbi:hypothetical protein [Aneurinibacillus migulanus]|uniref:Uncharacterized protein n=1 Tax=Aneurinibacillus migulanus TaxID=47500 RepID=A0A1G8WRI6_ANEMI|nr:hypothetical protein [Aneurinibacillus migulanus]MED0890847.1 hypothetical protein [Aneurinibacillus migulanus]MED1618418.1 hypothetical protein [Aneurinibacillus migulanus]GED14728.1 hypothetical protein AMI01nite_27190 [Aneurinibacillus migulanus]SDJ81002.1 hypothetical protein SAMN04487909_1299 [Aneurinibacillus migulanus]
MAVLRNVVQIRGDLLLKQDMTLKANDQNAIKQLKLKIQHY